MEEGRDACMQKHIDIQRRETFREGRPFYVRGEKARALNGLDLDDGSKKEDPRERGGIKTVTRRLIVIRIS